VQQMWNRPFTVPWGDFPRVAEDATQGPSRSAHRRSIPHRGVDQFREILWTPRHRRRLLGLFG
jgi:hypothetical protein